MDLEGLLRHGIDSSANTEVRTPGGTSGEVGGGSLEEEPSGRKSVSGFRKWRRSGRHLEVCNGWFF